MIVYAVVDDALSPDFPLGVALEVLTRRAEAERSGSHRSPAAFLSSRIVSASESRAGIC